MARSERKLDFETGLVSLTEQQEELLDWLTGARPEGESLAGFARRMGVSESTLHRWKKDKSFLARWQERMVETHAHPDTLSKQLEVLNVKALAGDTKAIELYWKLVDKMSPDRVEVTGADAVKGMSDEALAQALQRAAEAAAKRAEPESPADQAARVRAELGLRAV
jgi:hypothetical protein